MLLVVLYLLKKGCYRRLTLERARSLVKPGLLVGSFLLFIINSTALIIHLETSFSHKDSVQVVVFCKHQNRRFSTVEP